MCAYWATFLPYYLIERPINSGTFGGPYLNTRKGRPIGRILLKSPGKTFGGWAVGNRQCLPRAFEAAPIEGAKTPSNEASGASQLRHEVLSPCPSEWSARPKGFIASRHWVPLVLNPPY
jgi:hypothetical protein